MHRQRLILCGIICLAAIIVVLVSRNPNPVEEARPVFDLPPVRPSEFRNSKPGVEFVGADVCAECHEDQYAEWRNTAHSRALAEIDPDREPPVGHVDDESQRLRYEIDVRDGRIWHSEIFITRQGNEVTLAQHPVRYVIGSGRFSRSYLIDVDGFLMESPCTWYSARPGWGLSPGYEDNDSGFERPAEVRCITCHAGRAEPIDNSPHRLAIRSQQIDCERCHGPGALHVDTEHRSSAGKDSDGRIAHPDRLPRARAEAVCAQCHFHGDASVAVRGRRLSDFRPGMALEDFQVHYAFDSSNREMTVVGHFEQMRLSACYQHSSEFTCTTCHDPHQRLDAADEQAYVRRQCIGCHARESCGLSPEDRVRIQPDDLCAKCHMPQVPTEIPHFAFTHHRVGIHEAGRRDDVLSAERDSPPPRLVPLDDLSWMPEIDQRRCLGLAYVQVLDQAEHAQHTEYFRQQAIQILEDVHRQGLADPEVDAALARLYFGQDHTRTMQYARSALAAESLSPDAESGALFALSGTLCELNRLQEALPYLERLVRLRRYGGAWHLLSLAREQQADLPGALQAALQAVEASPTSAAAADHVADLYRQAGDVERAHEFAARARLIAEFEELH
jgi:Cytochrome c554 and c-prime